MGNFSTLNALTITLVIPCYNEAGNLPSLIKRCCEVCDADESVDILLVDNGSTDETEAIINKGFGHSRISSLRVDVNQGYGFGITSGLKAAKGDIIGWTHADMQTDPMDVIEGLSLFRISANPVQLFVKGSRYGRPLSDQIFTWGMTAFASLALGSNVSDVNAQPTLFHRDFLKALTNSTKDFSLDLYVYIQALQRESTIQRFSVHFGSRTSGVGHNEGLASKIRFSIRTFRYILALRKKLRAQC